jgi:hypothetical protein
VGLAAGEVVQSCAEVGPLDRPKVRLQLVAQECGETGGAVRLHPLDLVIPRRPNDALLIRRWR